MAASINGLPDLAIFACVAELMSFTAAAQRLGIDRSVASKAVTRLEARLATRLIHRTTRKLSLTDAGQRLHRRVAPAFADIEAAERETLPKRGSPAGVLRVALPMSFGLLHVSPLLPQFMQRYPGVTLDVVFEDRQTDLVAAGVDLALRIALLKPSTLVAKRLARVRQVLVGAPAYLARHGAPSTPQELAGHRCLVYSLAAEPGVWAFMDAQGQAHRVRVRPAMTANNGLALREAVRGGAGLAMTPRFYIAEDLSAGRLREVMPAYRLPEFHLHAVMPTRRHITPACRAFIDFLVSRFGDPPYWD